jgi:hypothetical protein
MPMNLDAVGSTSDPVTRQWTSTDCLLYALGVGAGAVDPTGYELEYTTENSAEVEQRVLPTFATIVGVGGAARTTLGSFDPAMLVHGEQSIELHAPIASSGAVTTTSTVVGIYDKGSGALAVIESLSVDASTGAPRRPPPPPRARPTRSSATRPAPTRLFSTGCRGTGTPCTPIPSSPSGPASTGPSCTGSAPTDSRAGPCSTPCAARTRRASAPWRPASAGPPSRVTP